MAQLQALQIIGTQLIIREFCPRKMKYMRKKIVYIDMDGVLADFQSGMDKQGPEVVEKYKHHPDEIPGLYAVLEPVEGAVEAVRALNEKYDLYILSTAPWWNPSAWGDKLLWVKRYFGKEFYKKVILTHHKELNIGDYLIDDRDKNGAGEFQGERIPFGADVFPGWKEVTEYLIRKYY